MSKKPMFHLFIKNKWKNVYIANYDVKSNGMLISRKYIIFEATGWKFFITINSNIRGIKKNRMFQMIENVQSSGIYRKKSAGADGFVAISNIN